MTDCKAQSYLFDPNANPETTPWLSPAFGAGNIIFLSGQMSFNEHMQITGNDIEEQTTLTIARIKSVLEQLDLSLKNVVKITAWLAKREDFSGFNKAYAKMFDGIPPARSTVISELVLENALVEIEAVVAR